MKPSSEPGVMECCDQHGAIAVEPTLERVDGDEGHAYWHCQICGADEEVLVGFIYNEFLGDGAAESAAKGDNDAKV